jgi:hypothetical protein
MTKWRIAYVLAWVLPIWGLCVFSGFLIACFGEFGFYVTIGIIGACIASVLFIWAITHLTFNDEPVPAPTVYRKRKGD